MLTITGAIEECVKGIDKGITEGFAYRQMNISWYIKILRLVIPNEVAKAGRYTDAQIKELMCDLHNLKGKLDYFVSVLKHLLAEIEIHLIELLWKTVDTALTRLRLLKYKQLGRLKYK